MRIFQLLAVVGACVFVSAPALADDARSLTPRPGAPAPEQVQLGAHHDRAHALLRTTIGVLEARVGELERTIAFDVKEARELEAHAQIRDASAAAMTARAKEYREVAEKFPAGDVMRAELETVAKDLETFAAHDRDFATQRRAAAKILAEQAKTAAEWVKVDRATIEKYKALMQRLKPS